MKNPFMKMWEQVFPSDTESTHNRAIVLGNSMYSPLDAAKLTDESEETDIKRVSKSRLQLAYMRDPDTFNGVNKLTRLVLGEDIGWECASDEDAEYMRLWSENTGLYNVFHETIKNLLIYGIGWLECLYPAAPIENARGSAKKNGNRGIVGVDIVDPKTMDFLRNKEGKILYDTSGKPVGYVQRVSRDYNVPPDRDATKYGYYGGKAILLGPESVVPFVYEHFGGSADGIGVIEPQYDIIRQKKSIEKAYNQSCINRGPNRIVWTVGNENYRPTPNERADLEKKLMSLRPGDDIMVEHWATVESLKGQELDGVIESLRYCLGRQATAMGIPLPYLTEEGGEGGRLVLGDQRALLFKSIDTIRKRFAAQFEKMIIPLIMKNRSFAAPPKIKWSSLGLEDKESRSLRLQRYAKAEIITQDDTLETVVREEEGLPSVGTPKLPRKSMEDPPNKTDDEERAGTDMEDAA